MTGNAASIAVTSSRPPGATRSFAVVGAGLPITEADPDAYAALAWRSAAGAIDCTTTHPATSWGLAARLQ
jgi:hypothetical protein